jgi:hypothetical protein
MTPLAHAVRFAMRCGIESVEELASELECTQSAIYRAMKQLKVTDRTVKSDRAVSTVQSESDRTVSKSDRTVTGTIPATRAPKEYSSNIVISKKVKAKGAREVEEIEQLNGSTNRLCMKLGQWLCPLGSPDLETARDLLEGQVGVHGREKVLQGMLDLEALVASGERVNILKALPAFIRTARVQEERVDYQQESRNRAFALLERIKARETEAVQ